MTLMLAKCKCGQPRRAKGQGYCRDCHNAATRRYRVRGGRAWRPIASAPFSALAVVVLTKGGSVVKAEQRTGIADDGWVWVASNDGEHPESWTDGVCWSENADHEESDQPAWWVPLP